MASVVTGRPWAWRAGLMTSGRCRMGRGWSVVMVKKARLWELVATFLEKSRQIFTESRNGMGVMGL